MPKLGLTIEPEELWSFAKSSRLWSKRTWAQSQLISNSFLYLLAEEGFELVTVSSRTQLIIHQLGEFISMLLRFIAGAAPV